MHQRGACPQTPPSLCHLASGKYTFGQYTHLWMWYTKVMMRACVLLPQPRVADLYSLDKDELQSMLDPLKQRLDTVESEARETLDKVSLCVLCVCVSVCMC